MSAKEILEAMANGPKPVCRCSCDYTVNLVNLHNVMRGFKASPESLQGGAADCGVRRARKGASGRARKAHPTAQARDCQ